MMMMEIEGLGLKKGSGGVDGMGVEEGREGGAMAPDLSLTLL